MLDYGGVDCVFVGWGTATWGRGFGDEGFEDGLLVVDVSFVLLGCFFISILFFVCADPSLSASLSEES